MMSLENERKRERVRKPKKWKRERERDKLTNGGAEGRGYTNGCASKHEIPLLIYIEKEMIKIDIIDSSWRNRL